MITIVSHPYTRYYVVIKGRPEGPYSLDEIREMKLKPTDFVKPEGKGDFKEVREIAELSEQLNIRHQTTIPQYFATLDVRLLATAIDYFIALCAYAVIALIYIAGSINTQERIPMLLMGLLLIPIIKFLVSVATEGSAKQASIGKMLIGIKVTDMQGRPIGYALSFVRNIAKLIGIITLGLGFFSGFFDRKQQCLHDKIAGTLVIKDRLI